MKERKDTQTSMNFGNMPTSSVESSTPIVKIVNKSNNSLPEYETEGSAGQDIRAFLKEDMVINPFERVLIPTGLYIELAPGYEAQIRPRSGLALKKGLTFPNSPGTIDSDYRGEIGIIATNISDTPIVIENGDRIAQMVVTQYSRVEWKEVESLSDTVRGDGGFGHTGV